MSYEKSIKTIVVVSYNIRKGKKPELAGKLAKAVEEDRGCAAVSRLPRTARSSRPTPPLRRKLS